MKTGSLISIIAILGVSLTILTFVYQHIQNCETEGGSITGSLGCDKSNYTIMQELFQKKFSFVSSTIMDMADGAIRETISGDQNGNLMILLIKEDLDGPYYAEVSCKYVSGKTQKITKDIINYLENGGCFKENSNSSSESSLETSTASDMCQNQPPMFDAIVSIPPELPQRRVLFVKTNSIAYLCITYTSNTNNEGMFSFPTQLYTNYYSADMAPTSNVVLSGNQSYMQLGNNLSTVVTYTITTNNNTGTYWLQDPYNDALPIVVYSDEPKVDPSEIPLLIRISRPLTVVTTQVAGYDGGIMNFSYAKPLERLK